MNYRRESGDPKLDLKLNLSPPRPRGEISPSSSMERSPASSCVSREATPEDEQFFGNCPNSPEATTSMMLVGCPRCLMYVMLSVDDPKCPKCKSTVLLDFFREDRINNSKN